jgi:LysM repeat protein
VSVGGNCPSGRFWQVKPGDTFYLISMKLGVTVAELLRLNPGVNPDHLQPGETLCVAQQLPACASGVYWTVAAGDTLYNIAMATGTTVAVLLQLNPGVDPANLQIGQQICLP